MIIRSGIAKVRQISTSYKILVEPPIDLFVPWLNTQVSCYAYWRSDPGTTYADVFSITWETQFFYAFPLFSLIAHCLHKIVRVETEGIMIVPLWPTQPCTAVYT